MLLAAFACLIIAAIAALISHISKRPTIVLIAKIIFHICLLFFIVFFIVALFSSIPPPARNQSSLPI